MRVVLVHPHLFHHPAPIVPSGLLWLGAALRSRGHRVALLDLSFVWNRSRVIPGVVSSVEPDVIAFGVPHLDNECAPHSVSFLPTSRWVADALRAASKAPIVAGGWGMSRAPEEVLRYLGLRFGFAGGDLARAVEWLEAIAAGGADAEIPGAIRWNGSGYHRVASRPPCSGPVGQPAMAAHDLLDVRSHEAHGGSIVVPISCELDGIRARRDAAEIDHELGAVSCISSARRVTFAGWRVGAEPAADDVLLDRLASRGGTLAWEMDTPPGAVTRDRLVAARHAGAAAIRMRITRHDEWDPLRRDLERIPRGLPVVVEARLGGPGETGETFDRAARQLSTFGAKPERVILGTGLRLWSGEGPDVNERRGGAAGNSYIWPRFGFARATEAELDARLRALVSHRPGYSLDHDGFAPWQRWAHGASRRTGVWPAWRLDPYLADAAKHLRRHRIGRVPFRNEPR